MNLLWVGLLIAVLAGAAGWLSMRGQKPVEPIRARIDDKEDSSHSNAA